MEVQDKTFVCSVVFLDIVGYSKESVSQQMAWKRELNGMITSVISSLREDERIILDTGDGAALSFLGDPEIALVVGIRLLDLLKNRTPSNPAMLVRIGINLGAVKLLRDINGQPNLVGDGINVGQRVMSFAKPNQILASRSFFEVVSCLTREYQKLFHHLGSQKDKHTREHDVYEICAPGDQPLTEVKPVESAIPDDGPPGYCEVVLDPGTLAALEDVTKRYIGPLGAVLVKKSMKSAPNLRELCRVLSETVSNGDERKAFLKRAEEIVKAKEQEFQASPPTTSKTNVESTSTQNQTSSQWDTKTLTVLEHSLAEILGPLARILLKRAATQAKDSKELLNVLTDQIPTQQDRERFQKQIKSKLGW